MDPKPRGLGELDFGIILTMSIFKMSPPMLSIERGKLSFEGIDQEAGMNECNLVLSPDYREK